MLAFAMSCTVVEKTAYEFWTEFQCKLIRPPRLDDEEPPQSANLAPYWTWEVILQERYGAGSVQHIISKRHTQYYYRLNLGYERHEQVLIEAILYDSYDEKSWADPRHTYIDPYSE